MPTRNAPTAAETLHLRREAGDEHREAEHAEQQRLGLFDREQPRHDLPVPQGDVEDDDDGGQRDRHRRSRPARGSTPISERREHRQVERHREVLDHEHGEDDRRLAVRQAAEVARGAWR